MPEVDFRGFEVDNHMRYEADYCFALQEQDGMSKGGQRILDNLFTQPKKWDKTVELTNGEGIEFDKAAVDSYKYWVEKFLEVLYIPVPTTCGLLGKT